MTGNYGEHDVDVDLGKSHFSFTQCPLKTTQTMPMFMKNVLDFLMIFVKVTTMSYFAKKDPFKSKKTFLFHKNLIICL